MRTTKLSALATATLLAISLTGCGSSNDDGNSDSSDPKTAGPSPAVAAPAPDLDASAKAAIDTTNRACTLVPPAEVAKTSLHTVTEAVNGLNSPADPNGNNECEFHDALDQTLAYIVVRPQESPEANCDDPTSVEEVSDEVCVTKDEAEGSYMSFDYDANVADKWLKVSISIPDWTIHATDADRKDAEARAVALFQLAAANLQK